MTNSFDVADETEPIRRVLLQSVNQETRDAEGRPLSEAEVREKLEREHGVVYDTDEMVQLFDVQGFLAPFVVVRRKSDGAKGSLFFTHQPRFYFGFKPGA